MLIVYLLYNSCSLYINSSLSEKLFRKLFQMLGINASLFIAPLVCINFSILKFLFIRNPLLIFIGIKSSSHKALITNDL